MPTIKQIEANRRNAQRSTGPATPAAKAAVRFNALKTGIDAVSEIIPGEDPEKLNALATGLTEFWNPIGAHERELVDQLTDDSWRLRRLRSAETQIWTASIEDHRTSRIHHAHTEIGQAFSSHSNTLTRLQRFVTSIKRSIHQTTADLERLQAARRKAAAQEETQQSEPLAPPEEAHTEVEEQSQFDTPESPIYLIPSTNFSDLAPGPRDDRGDTIS